MQCVIRNNKKFRDGTPSMLNRLIVFFLKFTAHNKTEINMKERFFHY